MKLKIMKYFLIISILFIIQKSSFSQEIHTRTIYDFYSDEHELGKWKGYVYFLGPLLGAEGDIPLKSLIMNETGLYIENEIFFKINSFNFICDYEENIPCSVVQFKKMFAFYYSNFIKNVDLLISKKNIADTGDQCMIIQVRETESEEKKIIPYLICLYVSDQGFNLKTAIKNSYILYLRNVDIKELYDNVQIGEKFSVAFTFDGFFAYTAGGFIKESEFFLNSTSSNKTFIIPYNQIRSPLFRGLACEILYLDLKPPDILNVNDRNCCISFNYTFKNWFICSTQVSDCISPIRRMALYMERSCKYFLNYSSPITRNNSNYLNFIDDHENGLWFGWIFFTFLSEIQLQSKNPIYLKVNQNHLLLCLKDTSLPEKVIDILSLKWVCGPKTICSPELYEKYAYNQETIEDVMENSMLFLQMIEKDNKTCGIIQDFSNKEMMICTYVPEQFTSLQAALVLNYKNKLKGLSTVSPIPDDAILPILVTDCITYINEEIQFKSDEAILYKRKSSLPVVLYSKIDTINGESCQVLTRNYNIPRQILNYTIDSQNNTVKRGDCCLAFKYFERMVYMCSLSDRCEKIIEKVAKKLRLKCEKGRIPNNLENGPEIDYNGDIIDNHFVGFWAGYVKYAQLGIETPKKPMYVEVDTKKGQISIKSYSRSEEVLQIYDVLKLEWICQSELPCSAEEYLSKKNKPDLKRKVERIYLEMNIRSSLHCALLETRTTPFYFSQKIIGLFCPYDKNQGSNFRLAIKSAYDERILKTNVKNIPFAPEGSEFIISILNTNENTYNLTGFRMRLCPTHLEKLPDETSILDYQDMKEIGNVKCGIEFRNLSLPEPLLQLKITPQCCFAVMKNKDKIYICSRSEIRCVTQARMMMKRIKEDCMTLLSINHQVSSNELKEISEDYELVEDSPSIPNILGPPKTNDPYLNFDLEKNLWEGTIHLSSIDNKDQINLETKFLKLDQDFIKITQDTNTINNSHLTTSFHLFTVFFACNSPDLCYPSNYINEMSKVRSQYEIEFLSKAIENFLVKLPSTKESNCFILEIEDPYFHAIKPYIICADDQNQGFFLRKIISCRYEEKSLLFNFSKESSKFLPIISTKDRFPLRFYEENSEEITSYMTRFNEFWIKRESTDFTFLYFKEIDNCEIINPIQNKQILLKIKNDNIDFKCCFEVSRFEKPLIICSIDSFRCIRSKNMIMNYAKEKCVNPPKATSKLSQKSFKPNYYDDFDFETSRISEVVITADTDINPYKNDFFDDSKNGIWKGWVFASPLTERDATLKIQTFYLELNKDYLTYKSKPNGELTFLKKTNQLKLVCEDSIGPCTPSQYLEIQETKNVSFIGTFELEDAILNILDQMPSVDETGCSILEFEEPKTRMRVSELICSLFSQDGDSLRLAFHNAHYLSLIDANVYLDIPLISYMSEVFSVTIWEEKRLMDDMVIFNETGIIKANNIEISLYNYSSIADDKLGNKCGFWYKNLKLPEEFDNQDPNCCFTFFLKNGKNVYICAKYPLRCIRQGKILLLKMKIGCNAQNREHFPNPYENENTVSPILSVDNYFKVLYDDSSNGIWRGLVYHYKIGSEETLGDNPNYMKVENGYISFYQDELITDINGAEIQPIEKLIIRNMYFTCEQHYTCDTTNYIEYFKKTISDDGYDVFKLKQDIQKVVDKLPAGSNKDDCCTVVSFKDENSKKENHIICTRVPEQGNEIKKTLTKSLNNIILNSNIITEIPLATLDDVFVIQYYDAQYNVVKKFSARFGKFYLFESHSGEVIMKYTDVKNDSYAKQCAIWNSQLTIPTQMTIDTKECCFMFNKNDLSYYICISGDFHCLKKTRIMIKTLKQGCMAGDNGVDLNGNTKIDIPEVKNPNTEILGEKDSQSTQSEQGSTIGPFNFTHELNENLQVNAWNNTFYKSWVIEIILPNSPSEALSPREIYLEITKQNFKISEDINESLLEIFNLTNINWICPKEYSCLPSELMNHYRYSQDSNLDLSLLEAAYAKFIEIIDDEKRCVAIEFFKNNSSFTDKRIFCLPSFHEKIIDIFQKAILKGYHEAVKNIHFSELRLPLETKENFYIEYIAAGDKNIQSFLINFGEMGIEYEKETIFLYQNPDNCVFCYDLANKIENVHPDKKCCLQFKVSGLSSYICDQDAYRCDMNIKRIVKYLYKKCIDLNKNALSVAIPGKCNKETHGSLKSFPKSFNGNNDFNEAGKFENYARENIESLKKNDEIQQTIEKHLLRVNQHISQLNKNVVSSEQKGEDILNINSDGTKTLIKKNGEKIIFDDVTSVKTIINATTIEIKYFDGADYFVYNNGENIFRLPDKAIIKAKQGNYELLRPGMFFNLKSDGSVYLKEENGKSTSIDSHLKSTTTMKDGTKIINNKNDLIEIIENGVSTLIKTPQI